MTVGFGFTPNLLTLLSGNSQKEGARGLGRLHPYRRWGFSPRPENIGRPEWTTCRKYDQRPAAGQGLWHGESACPHVPSAASPGPGGLVAPCSNPKKITAQKLTIGK